MVRTIPLSRNGYQRVVVDVHMGERTWANDFRAELNNHFFRNYYGGGRPKDDGETLDEQGEQHDGG